MSIAYTGDVSPAATAWFSCVQLSRSSWPGYVPPHRSDTPHIGALARSGALRPLATVTPAVTCTVQATFMTGTLPREHGIVANGWLFRDLMEVWLWRQSNRLVDGEMIWQAGRRRDAAFTTANLFWWYNMAASHDIGVTPRPIYRADGRKLPDCYTKPLELRDELTARFGPFPLFHFWGPATSIAASRWIADAALHVRRTRSPTLTLVYLPHLDYDLQRFGPDDPRIAASLREVDAVAGDLIADAARDGARVIVLSEYGITPVSTPVHINRALRQAGLLRVRREGDGELLDPAQSDAFAVSDHQIAHVYVAKPELIEEVRRIVASLPGVECVLDRAEQSALAIDHARSGELVALARRDAWFTYYYWLDDRQRAGFRAPGRDPPQARLRSGRAVRRSRDPLPEACDRMAARPPRARLRDADGHHSARRNPGQGLARPRDRQCRRRPGFHIERKPSRA